MAYSSIGKFLAIGMQNGTLLVVDSTSFDEYAEKKERKGPAISVIKFSPDDKFCAVGGVDSTIIVYDVAE